MQKNQKLWSIFGLLVIMLIVTSNQVSKSNAITETFFAHDPFVNVTQCYPNLVSELPTDTNSYRVVYANTTMQNSYSTTLTSTGIFPASYGFEGNTTGIVPPDYFAINTPEGSTFTTETSVYAHNWLLDMSTTTSVSGAVGGQRYFEQPIGSTWNISFWFRMSGAAANAYMGAWFYDNYMSPLFGWITGQGGSNIMRFYYASTTINIAYSAGLWYFCELNVDETANTFDFLMNDVLKLDNYALYGSNNSLTGCRKFATYQYNSPSGVLHTYFDGIELTDTINGYTWRNKFEIIYSNTIILPVEVAYTGSVFAGFSCRYVISQHAFYNYSDSEQIISFNSVYLDGPAKTIITTANFTQNKIYVRMEEQTGSTYVVLLELVVNDVWIMYNITEINYHSLQVNSTGINFYLDIKYGTNLISIQRFYSASGPVNNIATFYHRFNQKAFNGLIYVRNAFLVSRTLKSPKQPADVYMSGKTEFGFIYDTITFKKEDIPLPTIDNPFWYYSTWTLEIDYTTDVFVGNEQYNWTYGFNVTKGVLIDGQKFYYEDQLVNPLSLGDWSWAFNWLRDGLCGIINIVWVFIQAIAFVIWSLVICYVFLGFLFGLLIPFVWNILVYWIIWGVNWVAFSILWLVMNIPLVFGAILWFIAVILAAIIWAITGGTIPYTDIFNNINNMFQLVLNYITSLASVVFENLDAFLEFAIIFLSLIAMLYVSLLKAKSAGFTNLVAKKQESLDSYLYVAKIPAQLLAKIREIVLG
jgi:hypothetical protein